MDNSTLVVSAEWLSNHLFDPNLIIIDCRFTLADPELGFKQYQTNHIPKAQYLGLNQDLSGLPTKHGGRHPFPPVADLCLKLGKLGIIRQETLVVAYDDYRLAFGARLWWMLKYLGHDRTVLLDGGYTNWEQAGYPVTSMITPTQAQEFIPAIRPELIVDIETVKAKKDLPGVVLIDSRSADRYRGENETLDPVGGHIPGAINYPWLEVTSSNGYLEAKTDLETRWRGMDEPTEIIVYCGSGVTACVNLLSLELISNSKGKLYVGSWSDWSSYLI